MEQVPTHSEENLASTYPPDVPTRKLTYSLAFFNLASLETDAVA